MTTQYQLVMNSGPTPGKIFPLEGDMITIGRESENGLVINDAEVSRKHAQLVLQGGKYIISDLGSTNGTFINGQRLTGQHILLPGEVVSLGEQINLLFEAVQPVDPNATMVSSAHISAPKPAVLPAQPIYAGQVPESPTPVPTSKFKNNNTRIILVVVILLLLCVICACGAFFWWVDANAYWCKFFPFLFPTGCG